MRLMMRALGREAELVLRQVGVARVLRSFLRLRAFAERASQARKGASEASASADIGWPPDVLDHLPRLCVGGVEPVLVPRKRVGKRRQHGRFGNGLDSE